MPVACDDRGGLVVDELPSFVPTPARGDEAAESEPLTGVELVLYFTDREPVGPYPLTVPARRAHHQRFNDLEGPEPVEIGVDYCCLIHSDVPIVVQHTRLDSRQAANALMSTIAYPGAYCRGRSALAFA